MYPTADDYSPLLSVTAPTVAAGLLTRPVANQTQSACTPTAWRHAKATSPPCALHGFYPPRDTSAPRVGRGGEDRKEDRQRRHRHGPLAPARGWLSLHRGEPTRRGHLEQRPVEVDGARRRPLPRGGSGRAGPVRRQRVVDSGSRLQKNWDRNVVPHRLVERDKRRDHTAGLAAVAVHRQTRVAGLDLDGPAAHQGAVEHRGVVVGGRHQGLLGVVAEQAVVEPDQRLPRHERDSALGHHPQPVDEPERVEEGVGVVEDPLVAHRVGLGQPHRDRLPAGRRVDHRGHVVRQLPSHREVLWVPELGDVVAKRRIREGVVIGRPDLACTKVIRVPRDGVEHRAAHCHERLDPRQVLYDVRVLGVVGREGAQPRSDPRVRAHEQRPGRGLPGVRLDQPGPDRRHVGQVPLGEGCVAQLLVAVRVPEDGARRTSGRLLAGSVVDQRDGVGRVPRRQPKQQIQPGAGRKRQHLVPVPPRHGAVHGALARRHRPGVWHVVVERVLVRPADSEHRRRQVAGQRLPTRPPPRKHTRRQARRAQWRLHGRCAWCDGFNTIREQAMIRKCGTPRRDGFFRIDQRRVFGRTEQNGTADGRGCAGEQRAWLQCSP
eukprot:m.53712 g.53712  ORF g.53712 m.53712 type:complete len:603 (-) comp16690_c0_seq3:237-2045(-)